MQNQFERTEMLIGVAAVEKLKTVKIAIFGIGGVGSFVAEALVRSGIESFILIDNDTVSVSNINRQIHSLNSTVGQYKADVMKKRMLDINPIAKVEIVKEYVKFDSGLDFLKKNVDYVIDAIDTSYSKLDIVEKATNFKIPVISAMSAGNKLDPTKFEVADIYETSICPLAKKMRKDLKQRNIKKLKVVYSKETPIDTLSVLDDKGNKIPASISFMPSVLGLIVAGEVIKDIIKGEELK